VALQASLGGYSPPADYEVNGRQYIVIAADRAAENWREPAMSTLPLPLPAAVTHGAGREEVRHSLVLYRRPDLRICRYNTERLRTRQTES